MEIQCDGDDVNKRRKTWTKTSKLFEFYNEWIFMFGFLCRINSMNFDNLYTLFFYHSIGFVRYFFFPKINLHDCDDIRNSVLLLLFLFLILFFSLKIVRHSLRMRHERIVHIISAEQNILGALNGCCCRWYSLSYCFHSKYNTQHWMKIMWKMIMSIAHCRFVRRIRTISNQNNKSWLDRIFELLLCLEHIFLRCTDWTLISR